MSKQDFVAIYRILLIDTKKKKLGDLIQWYKDFSLYWRTLKYVAIIDRYKA